jgi:hypothetical protein
VSLFQTVRQNADWVIAGGVPAVSVVLNFARTNRVQENALKLLAAGKLAVSHLHILTAKEAARYGAKAEKKFETWRKK